MEILLLHVVLIGAFWSGGSHQVLYTIPGIPYRTRLVLANDQNVPPLVLNMISFDFSHATRTNGSSVSLLSVLSVTDVPDILNGTKINCTDPSPMEASTPTVTVHIIRTDLGEFDWLQYIIKYRNSLHS